MSDKKCENCFFWSQLLARGGLGSSVEAMCLNMESDKKNQWTTGKNGCDSFDESNGASVDL